MTTGQIFGLKRAQTCFESALRVEDNPLVAPSIEYVALGGMSSLQRIGRRINAPLDEPSG
jgi:hypothetical protein